MATLTKEEIINRKIGYYEVKYRYAKKSEMAYWDGCVWFRAGSRIWYDDNEFTKIDRIMIKLKNINKRTKV